MVVVVVVVVVGSFSLLQRLARQKHVLILDWKQSERINATKGWFNVIVSFDHELAIINSLRSIRPTP